MTAYYSENDPFAAAWLNELIKENLIAPGEVDTRSIRDVAAGDLRGFTQVHLFAGVGGWAYALHLAGWPDGRPVWTGSCPCQPFSGAGKRGGTADSRHLWPEMQRLIAEHQPPAVFGEQVASKDGRLWLAGVRADLEALGYAVGAADLCAAGVGAPHIRQRLFWVADSQHAVGRPECEIDTDTHGRNGLGGRGDTGRLADSGREHSAGRREFRDVECEAPTNERARGERQRVRNPADHRGSTSGMGDSHDARPQGRRQRSDERADQFTPWSASVFIPCLDRKYRRVPANEAAEPEPALFPLAHGISNRVGKLRGAGNAIVPQVAAEFIRASMST